MQIRYVLIVAGYISLLTICFIYKYQRDSLNEKLNAVKFHSQQVEKSLDLAEQENAKEKQKLDKHLHKIKSAHVPQDCQGSFDWVVEQMKN